MSDYIEDIAVACPAVMKDAGNQIACCVGNSLADLETFKLPNMTDGVNDFCCVKTRVKQAFLNAVSSPLSRPDFDIPDEDGNYNLDMDLIAATQADLYLYEIQYDEDGVEIPQSIPTDCLVLAVGNNANRLFAAMGLTKIIHEEG